MMEKKFIKLMDICRSNDLNELKKWLLKYPKKNLNVLDDASETALHIAVRSGQKDMVHLLRKHGADISIKNALGQTPVLLAALADHQDIFDYFILVLTNHKQYRDMVFLSKDVDGVGLLEALAMHRHEKRMVNLINMGLPIDNHRHFVIAGNPAVSCNLLRFAVHYEMGSLLNLLINKNVFSFEQKRRACYQAIATGRLNEAMQILLKHPDLLVIENKLYDYHEPWFSVDFARQQMMIGLVHLYKKHHTDWHACVIKILSYYDSQNNSVFDRFFSERRIRMHRLLTQGKKDILTPEGLKDALANIPVKTHRGPQFELVRWMLNRVSDEAMSKESLSTAVTL